MTQGLALPGACYWRRKDRGRWHEGNAVSVLRDAEGTVDVRDEHGEPVLVPNDRRFIKERKR